MGRVLVKNVVDVLVAVSRVIVLVDVVVGITSRLEMSEMRSMSGGAPVADGVDVVIAAVSSLSMSVVNSATRPRKKTRIFMFGG